MSALTRRPILAAFCALALLWGSAAPARAVTPEAAREFVGNLAERATAILGSSAPRAERRDQLRALLHEGFDVPFVARTVLGAPYRDLSDAQRDAYVAAFERWVVASYADRLDDYTGQRLVIIGAEAQGTQDARVTTRVEGLSPPPRIDWRIRDRPTGLSIIDIEVEGVSMAISQRSEFASVVQRRGIDGLIAMLEERSGPLM